MGEVGRAGPATGAEIPRSGRGTTPAVRWLTGGIVAHDEVRGVGIAIDSLLEQELPPGFEWGAIWVVASGCRDGTERVVELRAGRDPRVRLIVEPERRGKAHALREVFRRATGTALVLLNADARAAPGAVAALLDRAASLEPPYAVMARPTPPSTGPRDPLGSMFELLWGLHHEFHREVVGQGGPTHLSDELLLLGLPLLPELPEGVINDGAYLATWLSTHGGRCAYADSARVAIEIPSSFRDHLHQRRRILAGHRQVDALSGQSPATLPSFARRRPREALGMWRRAIRGTRATAGPVALLVAGEIGATLLAAWDRLPPRRSHTVWRAIETRPPPPIVGGPPGTGPGTAASASAVDRRLEAVLRLAHRFRTSVELPELAALLPPETGLDAEGVANWLVLHPEIGRVEDGRALPTGQVVPPDPARRDRGGAYLGVAERLIGEQLAPLHRWIRCAALTGSAAYGEPEEGDDLDFFVVVRGGALWLFLALTYLVVRFRYRPDPTAGRPAACFNFVVDEHAAVEELARRRSLLVARDALSARPLLGAAYYRSLLGTAGWMAEELPRLYARQASSEPVDPPSSVGVPTRLLNAAVFPLLASYLQLRGLGGNARFGASRRADLEFRTVTQPGQIAFLSSRYDRIGDELTDGLPGRSTPDGGAVGATTAPRVAR